MDLSPKPCYYKKEQKATNNIIHIKFKNTKNNSVQLHGDIVWDYVYK